MNITDKVKQLREGIGAAYVRPPREKLDRFKSALRGSNPALEYLKGRGLTEETIAHYQLGFDEERNAISIPIFKRGELINIKYRLLSPQEGQPKYTQEKDAEIWIYNEEGIKKGIEKKGILITEGEFDLMMAWQAGIENVVSPASGKDSYGVWLELMDSIPKVYIAYDNDKGGRETSIKLSERIGVEKCFEVLYPDGIKDANDYFLAGHTADEYKKLLTAARPFYTYQFKGVGEIIQELRTNRNDTILLDYLPDVKLAPDWLVVVSGQSNIGKTSYVMNLAQQLVEKDIPTLVLPFERGTQVVGTRFLQVKYNYSEGDFITLEQPQWDTILKECLHLPLYFAMPGREETLEVIRKSKRIFDTRVVIVDHLDYMIRNSQHKEQEIGQTLQNMKRLAEEMKIIFIVVTHIRKIDSAGAKKRKKPGIEDLKGSASLYQDPECVVMLTKPIDGYLEVEIVKNKGKMSNRQYSFNAETGKLGVEGDVGVGYESVADKEFADF